MASKQRCKCWRKHSGNVMFTTHKRQATQRPDPVCAASVGVHKPRRLKEAGPGCWPHRHSSVWFYSPSHAVWKPEAGPTFIRGLKVFLALPILGYCRLHCGKGRSYQICCVKTYSKALQAVLGGNASIRSIGWRTSNPSKKVQCELPLLHSGARQESPWPNQTLLNTTLPEELHALCPQAILKPTPFEITFPKPHSTDKYTNSGVLLSGIHRETSLVSFPTMVNLLV